MMCTGNVECRIEEEEELGFKEEKMHEEELGFIFSTSLVSDSLAFLLFFQIV